MSKPKLRGDVKWFSNKVKGKRRRRPSPMQLIGLRMRDLCALFRSRYGTELPDDDAGRDDLYVAINHLACLAHPRRHIDAWMQTWAPWITAKEQLELVGRAMAMPERWTADKLAWRMRMTMEQRTVLGLTTIGAIDCPKAARAKRRRQQEKVRRQSNHRKRGAMPRKQYEASSISRAKPWLEQGISRATWYRIRANGETGTAPDRDVETGPPAA
jgi:hypothetical protein